MAKADEEKERIKHWFMKNIILPNNEVIDKPGFIVYQFHEKDKNSFMRELLIPENLLADIEKRTKEKYGDKGSMAIYAAGKKWGYRFAKGGLFPEFSKTSKKDFLGFLDAFAKLIESEYSSKFTYSLSEDDKIITFTGQDMVICKKSGDGGLFLGAWVGVWAHMHGNKNIEGEHVKCQGRGDKECIFICRPNTKPLVLLDDSRSLSIEMEFYALNKPMNVQSDFSLVRFLELGKINYEGGFFRINNERLVLNEASSLYFLEHELKNMNADKIIFDAASDYYKEFAKHNTLEMFIGLQMAFGNGELTIFKQKNGYVARYKYHPWTSLANEINFQLLKGSLSGFLSEKEKRPVLFQKTMQTTENGYLEVVFNE